jgi:hypothetical protein
MKSKTFFKISKKEIKQFCNLTKDKNPIHFQSSQDFYDGKFKKALVPGLLLISKVNEILSKKYKGALIVDIIANFKLPVYHDEKCFIYFIITSINKKKKLYELKADLKIDKIDKAFVKIIFLTN